MGKAADKSGKTKTAKVATGKVPAGKAKKAKAPALKSAPPKAFVKGDVFYNSNEKVCEAPRGHYEIAHETDCVGLCNCADRKVIRLSLDAFIQHVNEGRIAFVG